MNSTLNPSMKIGENGLCNICDLYKRYFDARRLRRELSFFKSFIGKGEKYDVMAGVSGGKDSTAMLYTLREMGFNPLAFTFDIGYYPRHEFTRAREVTRMLGVNHVVIDIRRYIHKADVKAYENTANLYSRPDSEELREEFRRIYVDERKYFSAKSRSSEPVVRTCQLCRRAVIRGYYSQAARRGIGMVALGINEWAGLSQDNLNAKSYTFSGIRKLQPGKNREPVYIAHLPFLLQRKLGETRKILKKVGWEPPTGERTVESNANSCLFARAAEEKFTRLMGFHPDTPRLSREITVGFITKKQASTALNEVHKSEKTVRQVLTDAKIIRHS